MQNRCFLSTWSTSCTLLQSLRISIHLIKTKKTISKVKIKLKSLNSQRSSNPSSSQNHKRRKPLKCKRSFLRKKKNLNHSSITCMKLRKKWKKNLILWMRLWRIWSRTSNPLKSPNSYSASKKHNIIVTWSKHSKNSLRETMMIVMTTVTMIYNHLSRTKTVVILLWLMWMKPTTCTLMLMSSCKRRDIFQLMLLKTTWTLLLKLLSKMTLIDQKYRIINK